MARKETPSKDFAQALHVEFGQNSFRPQILRLKNYPPQDLPYRFNSFSNPIGASVLSVPQCCGSGMYIRIPDPNFFHPGSQICIKEFKYFRLSLKNCFQVLGNMMRVVHPGSGFSTHPGSRIQGSKRHRIPDPQNFCT